MKRGHVQAVVTGSRRPLLLSDVTIIYYHFTRAPLKKSDLRDFLALQMTEKHGGGAQPI